MKDDEMWILFIVKLPRKLRRVNPDQLSRWTATLANALMMEKQLPVLQWPVCLWQGVGEVCYMNTQVYDYQSW